VNRIRLLPEQVANQIAAGEVVERPASVVKELVENALDAGASRISVDVQTGGRSLIRVTDDGVGMSRDDALLCLERHATSKIRRAEDLAAIATMGFRGEALPSIASVSRFTLTTRERDSGTVEATQVLLAGGKLLDVRSAGAPPGTSIEVRQLFYNLPARRKFLRSEETERAHIQHYLLLAALAFPEVGFSFTHDGRLVWQLPPLPHGQDVASRLVALRERLAALYGSDLRLLPVQFTTELQPRPGPAVDDEPLDSAGLREQPAPTPPEPHFRGNLAPTSGPTANGEGPTSNFHLWGFIGAPGVSRATREDQHLFVNRRPIENRGLNFALLEGYHTALMKGRYPVCCLFLEIPPSEVDVNIHPAKREVRFHAEREVRALVTQAVRAALLAYHASPAGASNPVTPAPAGSHAPTPAPTPAPAPAPVPSAPSETSAAGPDLPHPASGTAAGQDVVARQLDIELGTAALGPIFSAPPARRSGVEPTPAPPPTAPVEAGVAPLPSAPRESPEPAAEARPIAAAGPVPLLRVPLRLVGVIGRLYVVLESDRGLVLLDQHAAHERVLFERMLAQLEQGDAPSQRLLLAETVELSARDADFLRQLLPTLARLGVGLGEFGERTFLLDGLPPFVRVADARQFVIELVDRLKAAGQEVNTLRLGEDVVAKTVCRHAIKANDPLDDRELENLVEELRRCTMPYTCPHGRPTLIELSYRELERKFGRVQ